MRKMPAAGFASSARFAALVAAGALMLLQGCSNFGPSCTTSDDSNPPDPYTGGRTEDGAYTTSDWDGPLLWFPGGKRYDLEHGLGCTPANVVIYLAFNEKGSAAGSIAPAAGNMSILQAVDDKIIRIKNDTCSDYYLRVFASFPQCEGDGGAGDADGSPADGFADGISEASAD